MGHFKALCGMMTLTLLACAPAKDPEDDLDLDLSDPDDAKWTNLILSKTVPVCLYPPRSPHSAPHAPDAKG
jgi:hypothetical protein